MHEDAQELSKLLETCCCSEKPGSITFQMQSVELSDDNMKYDVQRKLLQVKELKDTTISIINNLFHFTSGGADIQVQTINMKTLPRQRMRALLEKITTMPEDANNSKLKVKELICSEQTHLPREIADLMTNTEALQVEVLKYGDVTVLSRTESSVYVNKISCLTTDAVLTASTGLLSLLKTGSWNKLCTRDFNIFIEFEIDKNKQRHPANLRVQRSSQGSINHEAYDQLIPLMLKLGCGNMEFSDMLLTAQYICENGKKNVDKITLSRISHEYLRVNSAPGFEIAKSLFQESGARLIQIESLLFHRISTDNYSRATEWNYKVLDLQYVAFGFLKDLLFLLKAPPTKVDRCSLLSLSELSSLQLLASNISQVGDLEITVEDIDALSNLHELIRGICWTNIILNLESLRIAIAKDPESHISISEMTVDRFSRLYESLLPLLHKNSIYRVERLITSVEKHIKCREVFECFTNGEKNKKIITLQVNELVSNGGVIDLLQLRLENESRFLIVSKIQTDCETVINFKNNRNNTIDTVSINVLTVESLSDIYTRVNGNGMKARSRSNWIFVINMCYFEEVGAVELKNRANGLVRQMTYSTMISNISSLKFPGRFDVEVFNGYNNLLRSGQIREMVFQKDFEFRTGRCSGEHNGELFGNIDYITVRDLKSFLDALEDKCPKIVEVKQCEITVDQDDIRKRLTGMDEDMYKILMNAALEATRQKMKEQLDMFTAIKRRFKDLRIETLTIKGGGQDVEAIATDVIVGNGNDDLFFEVANVKFDTLTLENHQLMLKVLNSGVGLEANVLLVNEPKEKLGDWTTTMNMINNNNFKVISIKTKHNLDDVLGIISEISPIIKPTSILAEDANLQIMNHSINKTKLMVAVEGNAQSKSIRELGGSLKMGVTTKNEYDKEHTASPVSNRPVPPPLPARRPMPPPQLPEGSSGESIYLCPDAPESKYENRRLPPPPTRRVQRSSEPDYDQVPDSPPLKPRYHRTTQPNSGGGSEHLYEIDNSIDDGEHLYQDPLQ